MIELESFRKIKNILLIENFFELREKKIDSELIQKKYLLEHSGLGFIKKFIEEKRITKEIIEKHYDFEKEIYENYEKTLKEIKELEKHKKSRNDISLLYSKDILDYEDKMMHLKRLKEKVSCGALKFAIHEYIENESYAERIKKRYPEIVEKIEKDISYNKGKGKTEKEQYASAFNMYLRKQKPNLTKELFAKTKAKLLNNKEKQEARIGLEAITTPAFATNPIGFVPRKALNGIIKTSTFLNISKKITNKIENIFEDLKLNYEKKSNELFKKFCICAVVANIGIMSADMLLVNHKPVDIKLYESILKESEIYSPSVNDKSEYVLHLKELVDEKQKNYYEEKINRRMDKNNHLNDINIKDDSNDLRKRENNDLDDINIKDLSNDGTKNKYRIR